MFLLFLPSCQGTNKVPIVTLFSWVGGRERKVSVGRVAVLWCPSQVPLPPFIPLLRTLISEGLRGAQSSADGTPAPLQSWPLALILILLPSLYGGVKVLQGPRLAQPHAPAWPLWVFSFLWQMVPVAMPRSASVKPQGGSQYPYLGVKGRLCH